MSYREDLISHIGNLKACSKPPRACYVCTGHIRCALKALRVYSSSESPWQLRISIICFLSIQRTDCNRLLVSWTPRRVLACDSLFSGRPGHRLWQTIGALGAQESTSLWQPVLWAPRAQTVTDYWCPGRSGEY